LGLKAARRRQGCAATSAPAACSHCPTGLLLRANLLCAFDCIAGTSTLPGGLPHHKTPQRPATEALNMQSASGPPPRATQAAHDPAPHEPFQVMPHIWHPYRTRLPQLPRVHYLLTHPSLGRCFCPNPFISGATNIPQDVAWFLAQARQYCTTSHAIMPSPLVDACRTVLCAKLPLSNCVPCTPPAAALAPSATVRSPHTHTHTHTFRCRPRNQRKPLASGLLCCMPCTATAHMGFAFLSTANGSSLPLKPGT
jgi:hypothetical protein